MTQEQKIEKNAKEFMKTASFGKSSFTIIQTTRLLRLFAQQQVKLFAIPVVSNNERSEVAVCDFDKGDGYVNCPMIGNVDCEDCSFFKKAN